MAADSGHLAQPDGRNGGAGMSWGPSPIRELCKLQIILSDPKRQDLRVSWERGVLRLSDQRNTRGAGRDGLPSVSG